VSGNVTHLVTANPYMTSKFAKAEVRMTLAHSLSASQAQGIQIVGEDFLVTGKKATVFTAANTGKKAVGVKWQYEESPGKWNDYEDGAMDIVEGAYEVRGSSGQPPTISLTSHRTRTGRRISVWMCALSRAAIGSTKWTSTK
jgi:hypothetical protein